MASVYLDKQSNNWKVKTKVNGRDSRPTLRRATTAERESWERGERSHPPDVLLLAGRHGAIFSSTKQPDEAPPDTIRGFIDWFESDYAKHRRPGSATKMGGILRHFRRFVGDDDREMVEVDADYMEAFFGWRLEQLDPRLKIRVKPHVVVGEMELLSGLFRAAIDRGLASSNPLTRLTKALGKSYPKPEKTKYLDPAEIKGFLATLDQTVADGTVPLDYADLAKVMLSTGLRVGAACSLEYEWVTPNWDVEVPARHDKCKTGYSTVVADLGREVLTRRRSASGGTGRVFPAGVNPNMAYYHLHNVGVFPHQLRHSFVTSLVDAEVPVQTIGGLLGHKHLQTTQRYAKVRDEAKRAAVARLTFG